MSDFTKLIDPYFFLRFCSFDIFLQAIYTIKNENSINNVNEIQSTGEHFIILAFPLVFLNTLNPDERVKHKILINYLNHYPCPYSYIIIF